jgi:Putative Actinobacterial Holin-X, holin superfamily III
VQEKLVAASKPAGSVAAGVTLAAYGLGFLLVSAMYGLCIVLQPWLAALIIGAALFAVGAILVSNGRRSLRNVTPPERTIQSVKENITWLKDQMK